MRRRHKRQDTRWNIPARGWQGEAQPPGAIGGDYSLNVIGARPPEPSPPEEEPPVPRVGDEGPAFTTSTPVRPSGHNHDAPLPPAEPVGPRRWLQQELVNLALDFGSEVWDLGRKLAPAVWTMEDAREAAGIVPEAFDGAE